MKLCRRCGKPKPLRDFVFTPRLIKAGRVYYPTYCKPCYYTWAYQKAKRHWADRLKKNRVIQKRWRDSGKERDIRIRYRKNPDYLAAVRLSQSIAKSRRRGASGFCSLEQFRGRFAFYGDCCAYCGSTEDLTIDHRIPISRGGTNWPSNLVPACRKCNKTKHTSLWPINYRASYPVGIAKLEM